jgi:hypothetical protein
MLFGMIKVFNLGKGKGLPHHAMKTQRGTGGVVLLVFNLGA